MTNLETESIYGILTMMINSTVYFIQSHPTFIICPTRQSCVQISLTKHHMQSQYSISFTNIHQTSFNPIPSRQYSTSQGCSQTCCIWGKPSASRACSSWSPGSGNDPRRPSLALRVPTGSIAQRFTMVFPRQNRGFDQKQYGKYPWY